MRVYHPALLLTLLATSLLARANDFAASSVVHSGKIASTALQSPGSLQLVSAAKLAAANVQRTDDLARVVNGLYFATRGTRMYSQFGMRGVPNIDFYSPAVSVYVDDIAQDMAFYTQPLVGVERIEVRKGPQSTLYGSAAQAGSIHIYSKAADNKQKFNGLFNVSNSDYSASLRAQAPILQDVLFTDIGLYHAHKNGSLQNPSNQRDAVDDSDDNLFKINLTWLPTNSLDFKLAYTNSAYKSHEEYYQAYQPSDYDVVANTPFDLTEPKLKREMQNASLRINYFANNWRLTAINAWQQRKFARTLFSGNHDPENQDTQSYELRASSDYPLDAEHLFDFVTGLYFERQQFTRMRRAVSPKVPAFLFAGDSNAQIDTDNSAVFADGSWHWHELTLTLGMRYDTFKNSMNYQRSGAQALTFNDHNQYHNLSKKLAIAWQPSANLNIYTLYSEGFKAGGFNRTADNIAQNLAFDPETSSNVELGFKLYSPRLQLAIDAALYRGKTTEIQQQLYAGAYMLLKNLGDAQTSGFELNVNKAATTNLEFEFGFALNNSKIENYIADANNPDINGNQVANVSPFSYQLAALYKLNFAKILGQFSLRLAAHGSSATYLDASNSLQQNPYTIYDGMLNWQYKNYTLQAYVNNIDDSRYRVYAFNLGPTSYAQFNQARNYGLSLAVAF